MASAAPSPGRSPRVSTQSRSTTVLLLISLRPEQWTKNLVVFAGALFGGQLTSAPALGAATGAFLIDILNVIILSTLISLPFVGGM